MTYEKKEAETFFHGARLRYINLLILLDMQESTFHPCQLKIRDSRLENYNLKKQNKMNNRLTQLSNSKSQRMVSI